jgi:dolichol-phosphate mannosyltransferase
MISLVLPVYNQADHIARVVGEYQSAMESLPGGYEIVLVPNGCRDNSVAVCESLAGPTVRVVSSVAGGWGRAVNLGLRSATGDLLCYTNSARTPGDDLVTVLKVALERPDAVVKATRRIREGWKRWLGSKLYNAECRLLLGTRSGDTNGTPKAFSRSLAELVNLTRQDDLIDAELLAVAARRGYPVVEVPVGARERHGGASTTKFKSAWKMYRGVFALRKSLRNPGVAA